MRTARAEVIPSAEQILKADHRSPVLYLRSFGDDGAKDESSKIVVSAIMGAHLTELVPTGEIQLAYSMEQFGPFIAIGRPDETLPTLGAARMYVSDETWMEVVNTMLPKARLVLFRAGSTPGFWWEVSAALKGVSPDRIIFWLPFGSTNNVMAYEAFSNALNSYIAHPLPTWVRGARFLYFDLNWQPHLSAPKIVGNLSEAYNLSEALDPIAKRASLTLKRPAVFPKRLLVEGPLVVLVAFICFKKWLAFYENM